MYYKVSSAEFIAQFAKMREEYPVIRDNTSTPTEIHKAAKFHDSYYLHHDSRSGFIVTGEGELKGVFSAVKGRGDILVQSAVKRGATFLDCFDGYLVNLYQRHGFGSWKIEPNWTPGGPAVHHMRYGAVSQADLAEAGRMLQVIYGK